jgi:hypothetical protein
MYCRLCLVIFGIIVAKVWISEGICGLRFYDPLYYFCIRLVLTWSMIFPLEIEHILLTLN